VALLCASASEAEVFMPQACVRAPRRRIGESPGATLTRRTLP
jgi:hypothetical protein